MKVQEGIVVVLPYGFSSWHDSGCIALDRWLEMRTARLVNIHWLVCDQAVAEALLTRRSLTGSEIRQVVDSSNPLARANV
jgi:hypothetical protein